MEGLSALTDPALAAAYVARKTTVGRLRLLVDGGSVAARAPDAPPRRTDGAQPTLTEVRRL